MSPTVSVIIPTYNRAKLVREAVDSVLAQTFEDFEVIVVDDGSTDDTGELLSGLDPRVIYVPRENHGRSAARNHALGLARGRYIAFLDSDDLYLPQKLARQVAVMESEPGVNMIYTSAHNIDGDGNLYSFNYEASVDGWIYDKVAFFIPVTICLPTVMVRREVIDTVGGFDEQMHRFEDTDMWRRICKRYEVRAIREPLIKVRYHDGNQMEDPDIVLRALDYYVEKILREDADQGVPKLRRMAARLYLHYAKAIRRHPVWAGREKPFYARAASYSAWTHMYETVISREVTRLYRWAKTAEYHAVSTVDRAEGRLFGEKRPMKNLARRILRPGARPVEIQAASSSPERMESLAKTVAHMARTGEGTDECLKHGALPVPVHFYSPVPDIAELERKDIWSKKSELAGVDFGTDRQLAFMKKIGERFGSECDWPSKAPSDPAAFHLANDSFSYGCAAALTGVLRHFRPRRVIEVGSGYSSRVINQAVTRNASEGEKPDYAIIDPYPGEMVSKGLPAVSELIERKVEDTPIERFLELKENDVLFVDSGHTVRIGGDVNFMVLDVLPKLAPGVVVHFHDIPMPYEYPKAYATNPAFRQFWTEGYLLQAFLAFNSEFRVLLGMQSLMTDHMDAFAAAFPKYARSANPLISGSLWLQRRPANGWED